MRGFKIPDWPNLSGVLDRVFLLDMHDIDGERGWRLECEFCLLVTCMRDADADVDMDMNNFDSQFV